MIILQVTENLMDEFMHKVVLMIEAGEFESDASLSSLVKILSLYISIRDWHLNKAHITRTILYAFRNRTHLLRPIQVLKNIKHYKVIKYSNHL